MQIDDHAGSSGLSCGSSGKALRQRTPFATYVCLLAVLLAGATWTWRSLAISCDVRDAIGGSLLLLAFIALVVRLRILSQVLQPKGPPRAETDRR